MRTTISSILGVFVACICAVSEAQYATSMIKLIASPDKYHGKKVIVHGYLHVQFEDHGLYLSKEDADFLNGENALWVNFPEDSKVDLNQDDVKMRSFHQTFDCQYVLIEGIFDSKSYGHLGAFTGELTNVKRIERNARWFDGKKKLKD